MNYRWRNSNFVMLVIAIVFLSVVPQQNVHAAAPSALRNEQLTVAAPPQPQAGPDADGDWVSDADEEIFKTDLFGLDTDEDGMSDFEEIFIWNTAPAKADLDSDRDGIFDVVEKTLFKSNPKSADKDRDGDLIFDKVELDYHTDPGNPDTDGDLIADFLEIFLLKSDPRVADVDEDSNGYPDVIQPWLPEHLQDTLCEADVTLTINSLNIIDAEEADSASNVQGGDEATLMYALQIGDPADPDQPLSQAHFDRKIWQGNVEEGDEITRFQPLKTMTVRCGEVVSLGLQALEDDAPWGGVTDMGFFRQDQQFLLNRIPVGWESGKPTVYIFEGVSIDSSYEYDVHYTVDIALGSVPLAAQEGEGVSGSANAVGRQPQSSTLHLAVGLLSAAGTESGPLGRLDEPATAILSGPNLDTEITIQFTPNVALVELPPGDYVMQVTAPPYEPKEVKFTLAEDYQKLSITLTRPPLALEKLVLLHHIGRTLVDYETGATVANLYNGSEQVLFRTDLPNAYLDLVQITQTFLDSNVTQRLKLPASVQGYASATYLAADLQRMLYVVTNDLWLANVDWETLQLVNERQVTNNGIFRPGNEFISWHGDAILARVQNQFVRIDLKTGEVAATPLVGYQIEKQRISPDGRIVVAGDSIYDVLTGKQLNLPDFTDKTSKFTVRWLTNTRFVILKGEGPNAEIAIYNRDGNTSSLVASLLGAFYPAYLDGAFYASSPSGTYFFAWTDNHITENALINAETGAVAASFTNILSGNIHWLDDTRFLFSRDEQSNFGQVKLEDQGTWLYDIASGATTKVLSYPYTSMAVLPAEQVAVFIANENLWQMGLGDLKPVQLTKTGGYRFTQVKPVQTVNLTGQ